MTLKPLMGFALLLSLATPVHAGLITADTGVTGEYLLNQAGANQLETWLGTGDLDFTKRWDGTTGATAVSWHLAVDGLEQTISIYDVTYNNKNYLLGGYRSVAITYNGDNRHDDNAFIFNLTSGVMLDNTDSLWNPGDSLSVYDHPDFFATFGGGYDLYGGQGTLDAYAYIDGIGAYTGPASSYGYSQGINLLGESGKTYFQVNGLETYTFTDADPAAPVPEPATMLLLGTGVAGLIGSRVRKKKKWLFRRICE